MLILSILTRYSPHYSGVKVWLEASPILTHVLEYNVDKAYIVVPFPASVFPIFVRV